MVALPLLWILAGAVLRFVLPWIIVGLQTVGKEGTWKAWPKFQPIYVTSFLLALLAYGVALLTIPGAWAWLQGQESIPLIGFAYTGSDITRQLIKPADTKVTRAISVMTAALMLLFCALLL